MTAAQWQFRKMSPAEKNLESVEREFFQEENINVRLVREVIQNSLDAAASKTAAAYSAGPVRVRFALAGLGNPLAAERAAPYFAGLQPHLEQLAAVGDLEDAILARLDQGNLAAGGVPYLVIEDDRTVGLNGDFRQYDDTAENPAKGNDFYWFFRNTGRSGKGDTDNGSWGLGKWVFPDASHIYSCLAVTRRSQDDETLLMGMTVLNKHTIDGQRYPPDGYFAELGDDGLQLPLQSSNPAHRPFIAQCIADFDLRLRHNPGLSVIIPFPRAGAAAAADGLSRDGLLAAVVRNYFYPIIAEQLEVTIAGAGATAHLTGATINDYLTDLDLGNTGEHSPESYRKLFAMYREIRNLPESNFIELTAPLADSPNYRHYADLITRRPDYEAGKLLAFRVETDVQRKNGARQDTAFQLYIQKDDALTEGHDYYVRGTLSIPDMDYIRRHRARALLVVNEREPLAAMLRDSEPPAHNTWRPQVDRVGKRWVAAPRRITSVRNAPAQLLRILESPPEGLQKDALADIFSWDGQRGDDRRPVGPVIKDPPGGYIVKPPAPPPPAPADFTIAPVATGFRVSCPSRMAAGGPLTARLQAAYVTPSGNPLLRYRELDFQLHGDGALPVTVQGGRYIPGSKGNELLLTIDDPAQFTLTAQGFDPQRDVHVRVERVVAAKDEGDDDTGV